VAEHRQEIVLRSIGSDGLLAGRLDGLQQLLALIAASTRSVTSTLTRSTPRIWPSSARSGWTIES
jgi:hypothetical protein